MANFTPLSALAGGVLIGLASVWLPLAGLLVGFGTRLGGGCTSRHGVCGLGRREARPVRGYLSACGAGLLFGFGLWLSGMANPR